MDERDAVILAHMRRELDPSLLGREAVWRPLAPPDRERYPEVMWVCHGAGMHVESRRFALIDDAVRELRRRRDDALLPRTLREFLDRQQAMFTVRLWAVPDDPDAHPGRIVMQRDAHAPLDEVAPDVQTMRFPIVRARVLEVTTTCCYLDDHELDVLARDITRRLRPALRTVASTNDESVDETSTSTASATDTQTQQSV